MTKRTTKTAKFARETLAARRRIVREMEKCCSMWRMATLARELRGLDEMIADLGIA